MSPRQLKMLFLLLEICGFSLHRTQVANTFLNQLGNLDGIMVLNRFPSSTLSCTSPVGTSILLLIHSGSSLAWGHKLSIQGRTSFSGSGVEEDRRVNQRVFNFPIAENPIFSLAIAKKPHSSCHKSTSSKACPAWHSA